MKTNYPHTSDDYRDLGYEYYKLAHRAGKLADQHEYGTATHRRCMHLWHLFFDRMDDCMRTAMEIDIEGE